MPGVHTAKLWILGGFELHFCDFPTAALAISLSWLSLSAFCSVQMGVLYGAMALFRGGYPFAHGNAETFAFAAPVPRGVQGV